MRCECDCGNMAQCAYVDLYSGTRYELCQNCMMLFVNIALSPKQFKALLQHGHSGNEHMLHSDFYDEDGNALQPFREVKR